MADEKEPIPFGLPKRKADQGDNLIKSYPAGRDIPKLTLPKLPPRKKEGFFRRTWRKIVRIGRR